MAKDANALTQTPYSAQIISYNVVPALSAVTLSTNLSSPRVIDTQITLSAVATGGANRVYQFTATLAGTTTTLQNSALSTCSWTPQAVGNYSLQVAVYDLNGPHPTQATTSLSLQYVINQPLGTQVTLTSPQSTYPTKYAVGTPISLIATVTGGSGALPQYEFFANGTVVQTYSSSPSCIWTPSVDGYYAMTVSVQDANGAQTAPITSPPIAFNIVQALSLVSLSVSPLSPSMVNTPITLTAKAIGGANVVYQFTVTNNNNNLGPQTLNANPSPNNSIGWTPVQGGIYTVTVSATDQNSGAPTQALTATLQYVIDDSFNNVTVTLTTNPPTPGEANSPVTLTAATVNSGGAIDPVANITYQFEVTGSNPTSFSSSPTYQWTPPATGPYTLTVNAEVQGTTITKTASLVYNVVSPLTSTYLTMNPANAAPAGTPVTLAANSVGGANVQYQFWVYNPAATPTWSQLQGYTSASTYLWTPQVPGSYVISATAQDVVSGIQKNVMLSYSVTIAPLTSVSATATPASPQAVNTPITFTATAVGGLNIQYQYWIYNANASPAWSQLQGYSSQNTCTWTPTTAGSYVISVTAQDGNTNALVNQLVWYTVNLPTTLSAVSVTPTPASPQPADTAISLVATATGGTNVQYQFWVYNAAAIPAWSQLQTYTPQNTYTWTPNTPGNYLLSITAEDVTGAAVNTMLWYTINSAVPLSSVAVTSTPASPQPANTAINLVATATGGTNVQYQFWVYNASAVPAWVQLQGYSAQPTCSWTPTAIGNYLLSITAQDGVTGAIANTMVWYTINPPMALSSVSVTSTPASPQPANTKISLAASATGGTNVQYQFWVYNATATPTWQQLQGYSAQSTCSWQPTTTGNYLLSITAQDGITSVIANTMVWYTIQ